MDKIIYRHCETPLDECPMEDEDNQHWKCNGGECQCECHMKNLNALVQEFDELMLNLPVNTNQLYFEGLNGEKIETARMATIKSFLSQAMEKARQEERERIEKEVEKLEVSSYPAVFDDEDVIQKERVLSIIHKK